MASAEVAGWILPQEASRFARAELHPPRWGTLGYLYLWQEPQLVADGVCVVEGRGVSLRIENEAALGERERLDPPLTPFQTVAERRFRALAEGDSGGCPSDRPYWRWSIAPSAEPIGRVAALMRAAAAASASGGRLPFRLTCIPMPAGSEDLKAEHPCRDPRALLRRLTPDLLKRVSSAGCSGDIALDEHGACLAAEYEDPAARGTHSFYLVRLDGTGPLRSVEIVQGMLPPH